MQKIDTDDDLCIGTEPNMHVHASHEPLTLSEHLAIYWLPKAISLPWVARNTIRRQAARELGLPAPDRSTLLSKAHTYTGIAKASVFVLFPLALACHVVGKIIDRFYSSKD